MNEELKVIISAEIGDLKKGVQDAQKEVYNLSSKGKSGFKEFSGAAQSAGKVVKNGLKIAGAAIAAAGTALIALAETTKEYRANQAKLNTAFETAGASAETAKTTYNDLFRVLGDDDTATEAAGHLAKLSTNQKDLSQWTNICQGVYATFGDSLPIEGLTEAANETAKVGTVTGGLADALNWAGISEEDFNAKLAACNTEAEREKLIRETLNGVYEDAASNYEKNAADTLAQNEAQAKLNESMASLGETMQPVITAFTTFMADVLAQLTPYIQQLAEEYAPILEEVLTAIGTAIGTIITWIVDNWELISTIATIIGAIAAAVLVVNAAITAYNVVMGICNAVMYASPITWIIAAIVALIAIIILCIVYWDEIAAACGKAWDWIKGVWDAVATWFNENVIQPVVGFFSGLWDGICKIFQNVSKWFGEKFKAAKDGITNAFSAIGNFFSNIWSKITGVFSKVGGWFKEKFTAAVTGIKNVFNTVVSFFTGIWSKITGIFSKVGSAIAGAISGAVKGAINAVLSTAIGIINGFIAAINFAIGIINMIPGVNIGKLKSLSVPKLAKGGIIDSATLAVVGEQGKEAVVPLENNLEWLDKLSGMLAERMGGAGSTPIVLEVDGKTFAETSINTMNQRTIQTGKLGLIIK